MYPRTLVSSRSLTDPSGALYTPSVTDAWSETGDDEALVITFDGLDADQRDGAELAAFTRDLKTPADDWEDNRATRTPFLFDSRSTLSPTESMQVLFLSVLGIAVGWCPSPPGAAWARAPESSNRIAQRLREGEKDVPRVHRVQELLGRPKA